MPLDNQGTIHVTSYTLNLWVVSNSGCVVGAPETSLRLRDVFTQEPTGNVTADVLNVEGGLVLQVAGPISGTDYSPLHVTKSVSLGGSFALDLLGGYTPTPGVNFTVVDNQRGLPIDGVFANLAEGTPLTLGGQPYHATYRGGTGHDLALIADHVLLTPTFSNLSTPSVMVGTATATFTGTISDPPGQFPSGSVLVTVSGTSVPASIAADGTFSATIPTGTLGVGTYSVAVSYPGDASFTSATASGSLQVTYGVRFVAEPDDAEAGSAVVFRIELVDAQGNDLSSWNVTVQAVGMTSAGSPGTVLPVQAPGNSNPGNVFYYQTAQGGRYQYTLKLPRTLPSGTYLLDFTVAGDPVEHTIPFTVEGAD
jgi:hypothetical protein